VQFEYVRSEMNTQFANIATPSEIVMAVTFTLELSGNSAEMHICLPYSMIEPIRDVLYSTMHSEQVSSDKRWTTLLTRNLKMAEVELRVPLAETQVTLRQVVNLKVGDVIPIDIGNHVQAMVDGVPVMDCRYGLQNSQVALKIERFLALDDAQQ
jgi:flagellar motor switch protein FliM